MVVEMRSDNEEIRFAWKEIAVKMEYLQAWKEALERSQEKVR
jgi:hypothetical protein